MAEFERTSRPSTVVANKISAVKRKGTSRTFTQQMQPQSNDKGKSKASGEPSGAPHKKNRRGGKGKGKAWAHKIVSSALIPHDITKRLQGSHHVAVEPLAPAPRPFSLGIIVGGPSRAPAGASCQIASFNSSGMTTCPIEPLTRHSFSGWSGVRGPNSLTKVEREREFPPLVPVQVSQPVTPIVARATIVDNVVASSSCLTLEDLPATAPLGECISSPIVEECVQSEQHPKNKKPRTRRGKKARKEAVHPAPINPSIEGNVVVFPEVPVSNQEQLCAYQRYELTYKPQMDFSNPIDENGEHMFVQPVLNHSNPYNGNEVNPRFKCAVFYQYLIRCMEQGMEIEDPYLDNITDCPDDVSLGSEDKEKHPSAVRQPPLRTWKTMEEMRRDAPPLSPYHRGWEDNLDNKLFFDMGPNGRHRYEYPYSSTTTTNSNQLLAAIDSAVSSIEENKIIPHALNCVKCAKSRNSKTIELLADSGASLNFTNQRSDLCEYEEIESQSVMTASADSPLLAVGKGAMFISTSVLCKGKETDRIICLYPVYYIKGLTHRYLSIGTLLNQGLELRGSSSELQFRNHKQHRLEFVCKPHEPGQTIYWLSAKLASADSLLAKSVVKSADYDILHRHFAHPSKDVL